jgi:hypothetical protein
MVRKILSDLISGVRTGITWGLCFTPPKSRLWLLIDMVSPPPTSPAPWPQVVARAEKKRAELAAKNRYGRFLDLTELDTMAWPMSAELREQYERSARVMANEFATPITIISYDGRELAIIEPSSPELEDCSREFSPSRN